jgi:outer membrane protein OmpA-like peptidoglycan-associated protein
MKRFVTAIAVLLTSSAFICSNAAGKNCNDQFKGYWDVYVKGGVAHTFGEAKFGEMLSPAAAVGFGYHFTPVWGLRGDFSGWQAKGAAVVPASIYRFNFIQANADVTVDICNIFKCKPSRVLNPYLLAGIGANVRFGNKEAAEALTYLEHNYLWTGAKISPAARVGLGLGITLSEVIGLNIEVNTNFLNDRFNSKAGSKFDLQTNALVGLNFSFGKAKACSCSCTAAESVAAANAAMAASAAALAAAEQKAAEEKAAAEKAAAEKEAAAKAAAEKEAAAKAAAAKKASVSKCIEVYFKIGSWAVGQAEAQKVAELVEFMKNNPETTVTITGHADKETGTNERNMFVSEQRAQAVGKMIAEAGISQDRIKIEFKGATASPYTEASKNRIAICVAE